MGYLDKSAALLASSAFEGNIPWMYRDSEGLVTVGVGHQITLIAAKKLPFITSLEQPATSEAIENDYKRVLDLPKKLPAARYRTGSSLILSQASIEAILVKDLEHRDAKLKKYYTAYETYPAPAKLALLDMAFNIKPTSFWGWPKFDAAVNAQDWKTAAAQCHRRITGDGGVHRNAWTFDQFMLAERMQPVRKLPVNPPHYDGPAMLPQKGPVAIP